MTYEGLIGLSVGGLEPVELWGRIEEISEDRMSFDPPDGFLTPLRRFRVETSPNRPDLPLAAQPPTWPPPFPWKESLYCRVSVEADGRTEWIDHLQMQVTPVLEKGWGRSWRAVLAS